MVRMLWLIKCFVSVAWRLDHNWSQRLKTFLWELLVIKYVRQQKSKKRLSKCIEADPGSRKRTRAHWYTSPSPWGCTAPYFWLVWDPDPGSWYLWWPGLMCKHGPRLSCIYGPGLRTPNIPHPQASWETRVDVDNLQIGWSFLCD